SGWAAPGAVRAALGVRAVPARRPGRVGVGVRADVQSFATVISKQPSMGSSGSPGIDAEPYPRFSDEEMARRRGALAAAMAEAGVEHAVAYGSNRSGSAVGWLTRWPVTREALVVFTPGERDLLLVQFFNHVPNAQRVATEAEVRWGGRSTIATAVEELARRGARGRWTGRTGRIGRLGLIGPLGWREHAALRDVADEVVDLGGVYTQLRLRKSPEEL
ncbi:MAG: hypothetical protein ACRDMJ_18060, partial [Solirubrobacteraceae bacterium]